MKTLTAYQIQEARNWIVDAFEDCVETAKDLSDAEVEFAIERYFVGGLDVFRLSCGEVL